MLRKNKKSSILIFFLNILLDSALKCNTFKHFISSFQLKQFHISIINLIFIYFVNFCKYFIKNPKVFENCAVNNNTGKQKKDDFKLWEWQHHKLHY